MVDMVEKERERANVGVSLFFSFFFEKKRDRGSHSLTFSPPPPFVYSRSDKSVKNKSRSLHHPDWTATERFKIYRYVFRCDYASFR